MQATNDNGVGNGNQQNTKPNSVICADCDGNGINMYLSN